MPPFRYALSAWLPARTAIRGLRRGRSSAGRPHPARTPAAPLQLTAAPVGAGEEMTYQTGPAGLILESGRAVLRPG
jgi:hypothetical protein